eukprot:5273257-Prymnesium_polylepis.1
MRGLRQTRLRLEDGSPWRSSDRRLRSRAPGAVVYRTPSADAGWIGGGSAARIGGGKGGRCRITDERDDDEGITGDADASGDDGGVRAESVGGDASPSSSGSAPGGAIQEPDRSSSPSLHTSSTSRV